MKGPSTITACGVVLLIFTAACAVQTTSRNMSPSRRATPEQIRIRIFEGGRATIRHVPLEEYVRATIVSELTPAAGNAGVVGRMFEVQAVLSRTYALSHLHRHHRDGYDLCATTHCQLFEPGRLKGSRWASAATDAVRKTAGKVLWFGQEAAAALFHADCGGHTSAPATVWGGAPHPYLRARADDGPAARAHATWRYEATRDAIRLALNADTRTAIGSRLDDITVIERDDAGRAARIGLQGQRVRDVKGEVLRDALTRAFGMRTIKSTWFDIREERTSFIFEGRGFGHGVGLCQAGALARIEAGNSPSNVLLRYFPGTTLKTLD